MKHNESMILLVDDNMENLQILGEMLGKSGFSVAMASDGYGALEFIKEEKPDLILMDIMMPGLSGIDVCEELKQHPHTKNLPVIFISALSQTTDKLSAFQAGGIDFITKPFQRDEVLARVKTHISMKKILEENMLQRQELEKINTTKDLFFSIISHDLRSQVGGVAGVSQLLSKKADEDGLHEIKPFAERLEIASNKLFSLLENLLAWASLQKEGMKCQSRWIDIQEIIRICVQNISENAKLKHILIQNEVESRLVYVDENMISTVVRNLLSNAVKFTQEGGSIFVNSHLLNDKFMTVEVKDTGVGMEQNVINKLFEISEKTSTLGTNLEEGSGLGLILCKDLVEMNRGSIEVFSLKDIGTTIRFTVPMTKEMQ